MDQFFYFQCIRRTYLGFLNIFDNIKVHRYDDNSPNKDIKVPIKIAPKRKFYLWLNDRKFEKHYPIMAGSLNSISLDSQRMGNLNYELKLITTENEQREIFKVLNPIPYTFNFTLSIATKYLTDMDQIIEQITPFFTPFVVYRLTFPEVDINVNVKLSLESINLDSSNDLGMEQIKTYSSSMDFKADSFVFQPITDEKLIKKIIIPYYEKGFLPHGWDTLQVDKENKKLVGEYEKNKEVQYFEGAIEDGKKVITYELWGGNRE